MQELTMTRRSFVKTATLAGAALALGTQAAATSFGEATEAFAAEAGEMKMYVSACHGCIQVCPCRVYVRDGVVVKVEGHPIAPQNLGSMCLKGLSQLHTCYSPIRVLYPLKRTGDRGAANVAWERISWDEAVDLAGSWIAESVEKYGTYSIFCGCGGGGSYSTNQAQSLAFCVGAPNVIEPGCAQCYLPRVAITYYMGSGATQSIADSSANEMWKGLSPYEQKFGLKCDTVAHVVWGAQPSVSQTAQSGRSIADLRETGCKIVVVDPNMSPDAVKADVWLRVRPGSDAAMILCWIRYVIENNLYDEDFCKTWTNMPFIIDPDTKLPYFANDIFPDFVQSTPENTPAYVCFDLKTNSVQPLEFASKDVDPAIFWAGEVNGKQCRTGGQIYKDVADPYTLQKAEELCWIPAATIEKAIRIYTDAPVAGISNGVATEMQQNASQVVLGLVALDFMMGYFNKPGACITQNTRAATLPAGPQPRPTSTYAGRGMGTGFTLGRTKKEMDDLYNNLPEGTGQGTRSQFEIANQMILDGLGYKNHKGLIHWTQAHIPSVIEAVKTGEPYRPRVYFEVSGNKLCMIGNAGSMCDAFLKLDHAIAQYANITSEYVEFMDLVFPTEEWLECPIPARNQMNYVFPGTQAVHLGETVSFMVPINKIIRNFSNKLNAYLDAGNELVLGAIGAAVGAGPASPSEVVGAVGGEKQTSNNATYVHENFPDTYTLKFPLQRGALGEEEDSVIHQQMVDAFGAPSYDAFLNDVQYQQPDLDNPVGLPFVWPREVYWAYGQHEWIADDGLPMGVFTQSRKLEVYCSLLIQMAATGFPYTYPREQQPVDSSIGTEVLPTDPNYEYVGSYSPVCQHLEPAESPLEGDPGYDEKYPLAITSGRVYYFHHGTMRHAPFIRELYPVPDVRMHPDTAKQYKLKHMDWVKVTSRRASITGRVYETRSMHPKVLWMERMWHPECFDNAQPNKTGGWAETGINAITKNSAPYNEVFGSYTNRAFQVNIEPGEKPPNIWVEPKEFAPLLPSNPNQYSGATDGNVDMINQPVTPVVTFNDWQR